MGTFIFLAFISGFAFFAVLLLIAAGLDLVEKSSVGLLCCVISALTIFLLYQQLVYAYIVYAYAQGIFFVHAINISIKQEVQQARYVHQDGKRFVDKNGNRRDIPKEHDIANFFRAFFLAPFITLMFIFYYISE